jgi:glycosyltransferase involved in cell wall biosynthesis
MSKKVSIFFPFIENGASGGGNNFLKALRDEFKKMGCWVDHLNSADIIFFNSHNDVQNLIEFKARNPGKVFVHRVDGPMSVYTETNDMRDKEVRLLNNFVADGTVFQSKWSKEKNTDLGLIDGSNPNTIILNAPNPKVFFPKEKGVGDKIKIIASGWSTNKNKGSDTLKWLDVNLDYSKYSLEVIGPETKLFENIVELGVMDPLDIGKVLREYDIYFFPSIYEACSNALLEGIHCGLIPLARNSSSNIEIVNDQKLLFDEYEEILEKLDVISAEYLEEKSSNQLPMLNEVAKQYYNFGKSLKPRHKKISASILKLQHVWIKIQNKLSFK